MAMIDERGRILGRVNVIDAAAAVIVLILIPAAYGSYLLFRNPPPKLLTISPATLYQGNAPKIDIQGRDLRPFLRVSFNDVQGRSFLIASTTAARVDLPELAPGTYDVVLYDDQQEVARLPKALRILPLAPMPMLDMEVAGAFFDLGDPVPVKPGLRFPPTGEADAEVLSRGAALPGRLRLKVGDVRFSVPSQSTQIPATLRVHCGVAANGDGSLGCIAGNPRVPVAPGSVLTLMGPSGWARFQIDEVHLLAPPPVSQARVRFVATPDQLMLMKSGDADSSPKAAAPEHAATLVAIGSSQPITALEAGARAPLGAGLRLVDVTMRVPVEPSENGWKYKDEPFKAGAPFTFETPTYVIHGEVSSMMPPAPPATAPPVGK
jgi:hypothetical protein